MLVRNRNFGQKLKILVKNLKFWSKIEHFVKIEKLVKNQKHPLKGKMQNKRANKFLP